MKKQKTWFYFTMPFIFSILMVNLLLPSAFAKTDDSLSEKSEKIEKSTKNIDKETQSETTENKMAEQPDTLVPRQYRKVGALGTFSYFDLIIPSKFGITILYNRSLEKSSELEFVSGSVAPLLIDELGKFSDQRISYIARKYFNNGSFNFHYGLTYSMLKLTLGDELLNAVTAGNYPSIELIELHSLGFNLGLGNRWTYKNGLTWGIDWVSWYQPIYVTKEDVPYLDVATDSGDRDDVETAVDIINYFPRLALLKLQLGYSF